MGARESSGKAPVAASTDRPSPSRRMLSFAIKLVVSAACIAYVLNSVDLGVLVENITSAAWQWYLLALMLWLISQLMNSLRWYVLSKPLELPMGIRSYVELYFIGGFFNTFLPTLIGGDVVKAYYLTHGTQLRARSTTSVLMDRNVGVGGLLVVGCVASLVNPVSIGRTPPFLVFLVMLIAYLFANMIILAPAVHERTLAVLRRLHLASLATKFHNMFQSLGVYRSHLPRLGVMLVLSSGIHLLSFVAIFFIGRSIGADLPLYYYLIFVPITAVIAMLPISIGGLGVRETVFVTLFTSAGLTAEQSVSISLLWYAMLWLAGIPGMAFYLAKRR